jgi:hypothetical protein
MVGETFLFGSKVDPAREVATEIQVVARLPSALRRLARRGVSFCTLMGIQERALEVQMLSRFVHLVSLLEHRPRACSFENAEVELEGDERELRDRIASRSGVSSVAPRGLLRFVRSRRQLETGMHFCSSRIVSSDLASTTLWHVRAIRAQQGPWSRRRGVRATYGQVCVGRREPARVWILYACIANDTLHTG